MGAVYGYWKSNNGSAWALEYWEKYLTSQAKDLHVQSVVELCEAFRENRTHHRDHIRTMITDHFKPMILDKWAAEVEFNQRVLYDFMKELENLDYYDKDIWMKCFTTIGNKKRINNTTYFHYFNTVMRKLNTQPESPLFKQLDENIAKLKEKHYNVDR